MRLKKNNKFIVDEGLSKLEKEELNDSLMYACRNGKLDEVKSLLRKGADINYSDSGFRYDTPLHYACDNGNIDLVKFLVKNKADINATGYNESTPLIRSIENGNNDTALFLIQSGADLSIATDSGSLPIHTAISVCWDDLTVLSALVKAGADINAKDGFDEAPLHLAIKISSEASALFLLKKGADPNIKNHEGWTPLHYVMYADPQYSDKSVQENLIIALLKAGADPNIESNIGNTPMDVAKRFGRTEALSLLLEYTLFDTDLDEEDEDGDTILAKAVQRDNLAFAKKVIELGADINHISVRRAYMDRRYRNKETAKYVEDLVNNPKKKSKFDF